MNCSWSMGTNTTKNLIILSRKSNRHIFASCFRELQFKRTLLMCALSLQPYINFELDLEFELVSWQSQAPTLDCTVEPQPPIGNIELPPFWATDPQIWFAQVEAQFTTRRIAAQQSKFAHVVSALLCRHLRQTWIKETAIWPIQNESTPFIVSEYTTIYILKLSTVSLISLVF